MEPGKGSFQRHRRKSHFEIITGMNLAKAKHIFGEQALCISYFLSSSAIADFGEKPLSPIPLFCLVIETQIKGEAAPSMVWSMMACDLGASGEAQSTQGSQKASSNQVLDICNGCLSQTFPRKGQVSKLPPYPSSSSKVYW